VGGEGIRGWDGLDVLALDALCELRGHARIHLHRCAVLCLFQYFHGQVSRTWTDFKDLIRGSEVGLNSQVRAASEDIENEKNNLFNNSRGTSAFYIS
jgi:hypothetical protein